MEPFWQRVAETVAWCLPRANPSEPLSSLRSAEIKGRDLESSYVSTVRNVTQNRHYRLRSNGVVVESQGLCGGRLLLYYPDADLCDGAAEAESGGFFDAYNTPPWDTWVAFVSDDGYFPNRSYASYLVAWVPPVFLEDAAAGVVVNPEQCIEWLDESLEEASVALMKRLRE